MGYLTQQYFHNTSTVVLTSSFGIRVGQYATISCAFDRPPEKPVIPGGPDVITGAIPCRIDLPCLSLGL